MDIDLKNLKPKTKFEYIAKIKIEANTTDGLLSLLDSLKAKLLQGQVLTAIVSDDSRAYLSVQRRKRVK